MDERERRRKDEVRRKMQVLPNHFGKPGLEFLPDSSSDKIISRWRPHTEKWYEAMPNDCNCKNAFKDAGLDLEALDRLGVIVGSANVLRDETMTDQQVKVPRDIRFRDDVKKSISADRGFTFFVPGAPDTRPHLFLPATVFSLAWEIKLLRRRPLP